MTRPGIIALGTILMLVCLASSGVLFLVYEATRDSIDLRKEETRERSLRIVLPQAVRFSKPIAGSRIDYYIGYDQEGKTVGYAFIGSSQGYSSMIVVMAGVDDKGVLTGIDILEQKETPGLGDEAVRTHTDLTVWDVLSGRVGETPPPGRPFFQAQFVGKTITQLEVVKKADPQRIEAISGATVTSRAVTMAVRDSLEKLQAQGLSPGREDL